jgi:hypothetical protein
VPLPPQRLLEAEQIPHKVKPVSDYRNIGDIYVEQIASSTEVCLAPPPPLAPRLVRGRLRRLKPASVSASQPPLATQLRSIVMLNCGGIVDLMDHLQTRLDEEDEGSGAPRV